MTASPKQLRLLDAVFNRAREGVRVVEDHLRFVMDSPTLSRRAKDIRHDLTRAVGLCVDTSLLTRRRDVPGDVGRHAKTASEASRTDPAHLLSANFKRLQEALRSLEEHAKLMGHAQAARAFEDLRYRGYALEADVSGAAYRRGVLAGLDLYVLITASLCRRDVLRTVRDVIDGGAEVIQLREKEMSDRAFLDHARRVIEIAAPAEVPVFINDNVTVARLSGAAGVHVGQDDLPCRDIRTVCGADCLVGVSAGNVEQARAAEADGADCLGVGPVYYTDTKKVERGLGLDHLRKVAESTALPVYAIGGISAETIDPLLEAGFTSVAVCSAVIASEAPAGATARLRARIDRAREARAGKSATGGGPR